MKRNVTNLLIILLAVFIAVALLNFIQGLQALPTGGSGGGPVRLGLALPTFGTPPLLLFWIVSVFGIGLFLVA
ncbi:MAG: hypothetical protein R3291_05570, partial [Thermoplasmata archaeon]|nr:hypothetical protein [Thermoplasmata archaeon]